MNPLIGLLLSTVIYALVLSSDFGRRWTKEQTWSTVAVGVLLVCAWMALESREQAANTLIYFAVAGAPMVARSLWLQFHRYEAVIRHHTERQ